MNISECKREGEALLLKSEEGIFRITFCSENIVRVRYTCRDSFCDAKRSGILRDRIFSGWKLDESGEEIALSSGRLRLRIDRSGASVSYFDGGGKLLLAERRTKSREFEKAGELYRTGLHLMFQDGEAVYGFGQNDEGILNLRGKRLYVHHANRKIALPMMVSSLGYGILFHTCSPLIFSDEGEDAYIRTEADREMDFYFINGGSLDGVVAGYRFLSGKAAMLPRWAFGYIQSRERYKTQEEILAVAEEFQRRGLGLDCIVLDWCSWPEGLWGQKTVDTGRFPDMKKMTDALHEKNVRFMISVWPNMDEHSDNYREFADADLLLPGTNFYDPYGQEGRRLYWKQAKEGLYDYGVDAWWCDSSEPITPEWEHEDRPEPDAAYREFFEEGLRKLGAEGMLAYSFYHAMAMYEGQRGETDKKRVVNLTRSAYTGQQRFGTISWSGDIPADWDTLRRQIAGGLNFCVCGLPYWTTDIGAFFVKRGKPWYWAGKYEEGNLDPAYRELYVRWFQFGCFCPVFRSHGTDTYREPWLFGEEPVFQDGSSFYDILKRFNALRYRLLPYLYTCAFRAWKDDRTIFRMLAFDYPEDETAANCAEQFLLGDSLLVCPVLRPMYFDEGGKALSSDRTISVYLPAQEGGWYDFWTGERLEGGRMIKAVAGIDRIPVYVKAGTILPVADRGAFAEKAASERLMVQVYPGADARFTLYEDAGDGYGYEKGEYTATEMIWRDAAGELVIGKRRGAYPGMPADRQFDIVIQGRT